MKVVKITWVDSCSLFGWHSRGEEHNISECTTCGFLFKKDSKQVTVVQNYDDINVGNSTTIPRKAIISMEYL
jgi:Zn ribbon nucleic-acid-binding protein